jgi:hypothetical protein
MLRRVQQSLQAIAHTQGRIADKLDHLVKLNSNGRSARFCGHLYGVEKVEIRPLLLQEPLGLHFGVDGCWRCDV